MIRLIKKGISLVETMMVLSLLSIIIILSYSFIVTNDNAYSIVSKNSDTSINIRIAMEYLIDRIMNSRTVLLQEYNKPGVNASYIRVETRQGTPANILIVDGERIYIKKDTLIINGKERVENILRCDTDSQQVVPGIYAFEIWDMGEGLYKILLFLDNPNDHQDPEYPSAHYYSSYVKKRS